MEQDLGVQGHVHGGEGAQVLGRVEVDVQDPLDLARPLRRELDVAGLLVGGVVQAGAQPADEVGVAGVGGVEVGGAGEDERHHRLVDQHRVGLVDQRDGGLGLDDAVRVGGEPVPEQVEADLADRRVRHASLVGRTALGRRGRLAHPADRHAEQLVQRAHPFGVAARQVVVDRHDVDLPAAQRVPGRGEGAGEGLALAGGHLRDVPGQQRERPDELHVERPLAQRAAGGLPPERAEFGEVLLLAEDGHGGGQLGVGELPDPGLAPAGLGDQGAERCEVDAPRLLDEPPQPVTQRHGAASFHRSRVLPRRVRYCGPLHDPRAPPPGRPGVHSALGLIPISFLRRIRRPPRVWKHECITGFAVAGRDATAERGFA
ncbi:hypothetical protein GCM10010208_16940 [Actinomadura livida]|nr:hypothetical protein GCM10010208_16940 [Actinomadura livida]